MTFIASIAPHHTDWHNPFLILINERNNKKNPKYEDFYSTNHIIYFSITIHEKKIISFLSSSLFATILNERQTIKVHYNRDFLKSDQHFCRKSRKSQEIKNSVLI